MKRFFLAALLAASLCVAQGQRESVPGAYSAQFTITEGPPGIPPGYTFPVAFVLHSGGTLTAVSSDPGDGPGCGVWARDLNGDLVLTFLGFEFNSKGAAGSAKIRIRLKYDADHSLANGVWYLDLYDVNNSSLGFIRGTLTAARMMVEAPPN